MSVLVVTRRDLPAWRAALPIGLLLAALSLYYAFVATAGTFRLEAWHTDYYDLLAEAFRQGNLHLPVDPDPRLLAKDNPFSRRNSSLWLWDASLYGGRYYLYWGPTPGLLLLAFKLITRSSEKIYDQWLVIVFMCARLYAGAALLWVWSLRSRQLPRWVVLLAIAVFGLASPSPYFLARPLIYEASIACGQAFVLWGLFAAYRGLLDPLRKRVWFVGAGVCWALALASRGSLIAATPVLVVLSAVLANRRCSYPLRVIARDMLALGLPVVICLGAHAAYNYARFDSPSEFGLTYQLTSRPFGARWRFVLPNLVSYLSSEVAWSCEFPFASLPVKRELTDRIIWPEDYDSGDHDKGETAAGIFVATTICWLLWVWLGRACRGAPDALRRWRLRISNHELWLLACALALLLAMAPASRMWMANTRFLQDGMAGLLLASLLAGFWIIRRKRRTTLGPLTVLARVCFIGLALHTIAVGVLLGFTGHMENFRRENKALYEYLQRDLSICSRR